MKPQVLIVDDSLTIRMDLRSLLTGAGFAVTACETRALAQRVLKTKTFSLVILDVLLPDGDGLDLLREIRQTTDLMDVPVILLSTEVEVRHRIQGLRTGADEYIGKPYDGSYLVLRATQLVDERRLADVSSQGEGDAITGKKILVVDDSPTYRATLAQLLRQDGCEVIQALSGEEALHLLTIERVDCVIMDLLMPGIGGMEAARRIKTDPGTTRIPVVILTGHDDHATRREGANIGVDDFVIKSPDLPLLKARLRGVFRRRSPTGSEPRRDSSSRLSAHMFERGRASENGPSSVRESAPHSVVPVPGSLLDQVIAVSGLSSVIAASTIARACRRAGVDPLAMSTADLHQALPAIRETLRMFLAEEQYIAAIAELSLLARAAS